MGRSSGRDDPVIEVTMDAGRVVIRPAGRIDEVALATLRRLVDSARAAGVVPVVDLAASQVDPSGPITLRPR